jgi:hypothetical protein
VLGLVGSCWCRVGSVVEVLASSRQLCVLLGFVLVGSPAVPGREVVGGAICGCAW